MRKVLAFGVVLFLVILVVRAPASLITRFLDSGAPARIHELEGSVWSGSGHVLINDRPVGRLHWSFKPTSLLGLAVGYDLMLNGSGIALRGHAATNVTETTGALTGSVDGSFVNLWLAPYDIELGGAFEVNEVTVALEGRQLTGAGGRLAWSGGPVTYVLSGKMSSTRLTAMYADLGPGPVAVAFAEGESTPLLHAELKPDGFARIGVTKYLTKKLGNPWPGGDPDHAIVLEVEEQVF
jgi:hypothetical protein